jgi:two-component flavin-dependent monooxygenase
MPDSLLAVSAWIAEVAAKHVDAAEANRRLHAEVIDAVLEGGFARHFVPSRYGGRAGTFTELLGSVEVLAETCPSTAWYASLTASMGRMAAYLPDAGQAELWAAGPDPLIVGALMPLGQAESVDGGWRLSGTWPFVSVIDASDWALACGMAQTGADAPEPWFFALPRDSYQVEETWFTMAMRGTGSNTLVAHEVFVPAARACTRASLAAGPGPDWEAICHSVPMRAVNGLTFAAPVLGMARGAAAAWTSWVAGKVSTAGGHNAISSLDARSYELTLARATGETDAAAGLLARAAATADAGAMTPALVARSARDCALAAEMLVAATDRLLAGAGTRAYSENSPLQRFWRDIHAAASHIALQFEAPASAFAGPLLRRRTDDGDNGA